MPEDLNKQFQIVTLHALEAICDCLRGNHPVHSFGCEYYLKDMQRLRKKLERQKEKPCPK